jgi:UDP-N-acetyl-D-mannosaminouronate:lipid I N-acetyl-D-mannosaminouronosyltransferase
MKIKITLNGVSFYPFQSMNDIINHLKDNESGILFAVNARKLMTSPDYVKEAISNNIGYIDGVGAIWAAKRMGYKGKLPRLPGVEVWLEIIKDDPTKKYFLLGAKKEVLYETVSRLKQNYPTINIVGSHDGYFTEKDIPKIIESIQNSKAEIVFIAMGSPRQEKIMIELLKHHRAIYMGLGGSFDVYSGHVQRTPVFFQKLGMEGLYRFTTNPKRLFNRKIFYWDFFKHLILKKF